MPARRQARESCSTTLVCRARMPPTASSSGTTPRFADFFRSFTPVDELALLAIGSRPARRPGREDYLRSLRAIPWVFAWTQNRCLLPAWYGCGTRASRRRDLRELRRLYRMFPFFRSLVENLEMTLAKSSLEIARGYLAARAARGRAGAPLRRDRGRARAHRRRRARDRRGERAPRPPPGRAALDRGSGIRTSIR